MNFEPEYVVDLLARKGATHLYHANTVSTSCSLIRLGALCSRHEVEASGEFQTDQVSDELDRQYGIFDCVFLDTTDIHRAVQSHNHYGPVLFRFSPDILRQTAGNSVRITRVNPVYWVGLPEDQRWFQDHESLEANFEPGNLGQMLVIPSPGRSLTFNPTLHSVLIDNPRANVTGQNGHALAVRSLNEASGVSGVTLPAIEERHCMLGCTCVRNYQANYGFLYKFFLPRMGG